MSEIDKEEQRTGLNFDDYTQYIDELQDSSEHKTYLYCNDNCYLQWLETKENKMKEESIDHALKSLDQVYADLIEDGLPQGHKIYDMIDVLQYEITHANERD
jgi:hypothetical protein